VYNLFEKIATSKRGLYNKGGEDVSI